PTKGWAKPPDASSGPHRDLPAPAAGRVTLEHEHAQPGIGGEAPAHAPGAPARRQIRAGRERDGIRRERLGLALDLDDGRAEADDALDRPLAHRAQHAGHRLPHRLLDAEHLAVAVRDDAVVAVGSVPRNPAEVRDAHARVLKTREPDQPWQLHDPPALVTFEDRDQHPGQGPAARLSSHGSPGPTP